MNRRQWITAATVLVAPLLVFTLWSCLLAIHFLTVLLASREYVIENRTPQPLRVAPVMRPNEKPARMPFYASLWARILEPPTLVARRAAGHRAAGHR